MSARRSRPSAAAPSTPPATAPGRSTSTCSCSATSSSRTERLTLPHREVTSRRFVLVPLLELDPELCAPGRHPARRLARGARPGQRAERVQAFAADSDPSGRVDVGCVGAGALCGGRFAQRLEPGGRQDRRACRPGRRGRPASPGPGRPRRRSAGAGPAGSSPAQAGGDLEVGGVRLLAADRRRPRSARRPGRAARERRQVGADVLVVRLVDAGRGATRGAGASSRARSGTPSFAPSE